MKDDLRELAGIVRRSWSYADDKKEHFGVDIDRLLAEAEARLDSAKDKGDFARILQEFVAGMKDGHAAVHLPGVRPSAPLTWPFTVVDTREGILVKTVDPSAADEVVVGDAVVEVDGTAVDQRIAAAAKRVWASTDGARRHKALFEVRRTAKESAVLMLQRPNGATYTITIPTVLASTKGAANPETIESRLLDKDVGYLRVPTFDFDRREWGKAFEAGKTEEMGRILEREAEVIKAQIRQALSKLARTKAIVLDLRGNGGGTDLLGSFLSQQFLKAGFKYFGLSQRYSPDLKKLPEFKDLPEEGWSDPNYWEPYADPEIKPYPGRLVILIDEACFSTTDNFLACIADLHPDVRFVGRPSGGGTGAPRTAATLKHSRATVTFCVMKVWSPKGRLIEGRGTRPQVEVTWTRDDLLRKIDPDLEAGLREAGR